MTGINGAQRPIAREIIRAVEPQQQGSPLSKYTNDPKEKKQLDSMERGLQNQLRKAEDADHKVHIKQGTAGLYKPNTCYEFKVPIPKDTEDQSPIAGVFNYIKEAISPSPKYETIERCTNRYGDQPNLSINRKPTSILGVRG